MRRTSGRHELQEEAVNAGKQWTRESILTTLRSRTPSLASCSRDTNRVVSRPNDFSCRLALLLPLPVDPFSDMTPLAQEQFKQVAWSEVRGEATVRKWRDEDVRCVNRSGRRR